MKLAILMGLASGQVYIGSKNKQTNKRMMRQVCAAGIGHTSNCTIVGHFIWYLVLEICVMKKTKEVIVKFLEGDMVK